MRFELHNVAAKLRTFTARVEKHGDEDAPAITLGFTITAANTLLDLIDPAIRRALYKAVEGQEELPGVEQSTPLLVFAGFTSCALSACFEGWTLRIDHGIDEDDPIVLGACKVDAFKVEPSEGGSVDLQFRVGSSAVSREDAGLLWEMQRQEVRITLEAPKPKAEAIDGTVGHPALAGGDEPEAGDMFAEIHGQAGHTVEA